MKRKYEFEDADMDTILAALQVQPWNRVNGVMMKIMTQLNPPAPSHPEIPPAPVPVPEPMPK